MALKTIFRNLGNSFIDRLRQYKFNSDYRASLAIIEKVYEKYAEKINSQNSSRYLWRAVCQYKCQASARSKVVGLIANVVAFLGFPSLVFFLRPRRKMNDQITCKYLKINFHMAYQVPILIKYETLEKQAIHKYLTIADFIFALKLFLNNGAVYPELLFKFVFWIASVRPAIDLFHPQYLIQYCEYSATSSLRKLFLNSYGIRLANVTHGEEFISCLSAFSSFDQYFAWELSPHSIHEAMRIVYVDRFTFNPCANLELAPAVVTPTLGFLWPALDAADLDTLVVQLNKISEYCTVVVRPHPNRRFSNGFENYRHLLKVEVSDAHNEGIHNFIDRCALIAGKFSSAMVQAALRGREIIYLKDPYLERVREYHEYYKKFDLIPADMLDSIVSAKFAEIECSSISPR